MKTKTLTVPSSPMEVPMERYQEFQKLTDDQRFDFIELFSCLTGCTKEEARLVKATDVRRSVTALISALNDSDVELIEKYTHKGTTYGMEPQLDEINFAMMADVCTAFETPETWHKVLAILYRPIVREHKALGGMYAIEPHHADSDQYADRQEVFKKAPAALFVGVRSFFLRGSMALRNYTRDSLEPQLEKLMQSKGQKGS